MNTIAAITTILILTGIFIGIPVGIFFAIKHLIKFTTRTIYEEKARAEKRCHKSYDPEGDR